MTSVEGQDERVGTQPSPRELLDRAIALRPLLVEQAAETEARRYYSDEIHRAFDDAGFYRSLIPRRYGGLEFDVTNWLRLIEEVAHGDIQAAWGLTLAAGHSLQVGSFWTSRRRPRSSATATSARPSVAAPIGTRRGRRRLAAHRRIAYCSGAPYSTHYMGQTLMPRAAAARPGCCCSSPRAASGRCSTTGATCSG